ncbi:MAG: hypothetical protein OEW58_13450 [Gammaproteobacteria bacterium]|nr:hypothetical protein [Gammaproteobacteria bacterium]
MHNLSSNMIRISLAILLLFSTSAQAMLMTSLQTSDSVSSMSSTDHCQQPEADERHATCSHDHCSLCMIAVPNPPTASIPLLSPPQLPAVSMHSSEQRLNKLYRPPKRSAL